MNDTLDLHGYYPDEALERLDFFIDHAQMRGARRIRIIHGRGKNVLRSLIHEHLSTHPAIDEFQDSSFPDEFMAVTLADVSSLHV